MQIAALNLTHIYDPKTSNEFVALDHVSVSLPSDKKIIALVGHTGSGKTTFIKHLNALLLPTSGIVKVDNKIIGQNKKFKKLKNINSYRENIGMVFQFPEEQLFEETVHAEIAFGLQNFHKDQKDLDASINYALDSVGLNSSFAERLPFGLSEGEKRKVALASILALKPRLLVLDEPTASLDNKSTEKIYELIQKLAADGTQVIVVTHELKNVLAYAEHVVLFEKGKIVTSGGPLEVVYDVNLLRSHQLEIPKLVQLTEALNKKGLMIKPTRTIEEFIKEYKSIKDGAHE